MKVMVESVGQLVPAARLTQAEASDGVGAWGTARGVGSSRLSMSRRRASYGLTSDQNRAVMRAGPRAVSPTTANI